MIPNRCSQRGTWQLRMSERNLTLADVREGPEVSERDLTVAVGPRVECGLEIRPEAFSLDPQWANWYVKFVVRLRRSWCGGTHVTILTRVKIWPLQIPPSFDYQSNWRRIRRAKLVGTFKYFWVLLEVYASKDLVGMWHVFWMGEILFAVPANTSSE